ncbi:hypothetical protein EDC44_10494 [Cricetibacter osteomyelitidis]|uniref:PIN domain-containing protein n=1 Tax=Cricetibacter osteomyelitidis TaxID=1521931 RepID=A0A4R2T4W3_9PAST|nr:type II toxin-antitoxin system VapC family toxin [Cricetibacter osteomyelitidis]TCP96561.1 hypothetical protein EDC44_10494 [Cricetibacter osteomyelitidis]
MYLFDTNVISELRKKQPNQGVTRFINEINAKGEPILLSVITLGEIIKGIYALQQRGDIEQAKRLQYWYQSAIEPMRPLAVPFDAQCAEMWGKLIAENPHNVIDKQLVATAIVKNLIFVTRNTKDIQNTGVKYINPFD